MRKKCPHHKCTAQWTFSLVVILLLLRSQKHYQWTESSSFHIFAVPTISLKGNCYLDIFATNSICVWTWNWMKLHSLYALVFAFFPSLRLSMLLYFILITNTINIIVFHSYSYLILPCLNILWFISQFLLKGICVVSCLGIFQIVL